MTRLPYGNKRGLGVAAALAATMLMGLVPAYAQTATPEPVIDSAPGTVNFGKPALIKGHLDNGAPGDEVALEQRKGSGDWKVVSIKPVDENMKVRFKRTDMRKTTDFRLVWSNELQEIETKSEVVVVRVIPKLKFKVNPDDTYIGRTVTISGNLYPKVSGRRIVLKQKVSGEWRKVARVKAGNGEFSTTFTARHKGYRKIKAVFRGDGLNRSQRKRSPLRIYRKDRATWYGPGFWGNSTACGKTLKRHTLGVAHRTLPCGTMVSILYNGRTISVPVIDRGPYSHANWDLTQETAERVGFSGTDQIGVTK